MKVRPTCTDSAGNGYYQGTDGKIYPELFMMIHLTTAKAV